MRAPSRRLLGDVLLGILAGVVGVGAILSVTQNTGTVASLDSAGPTAGPTKAATAAPTAAPTTSPTTSPTQPPTSQTPTAAPTPEPTPTPTPAAGSASLVVLAGPDLATLKAGLVARTGYTVEVVPGAPPAVLAAGALDGVNATPSVVVLQVLAGANTSVRAKTAIDAVEQRWPSAQVLVVGPFSSGDRQSAASVKSAATAAGVTFLDPVAEQWRVADTTATLSPADLTDVTVKLADALA